MDTTSIILTSSVIAAVFSSTVSVLLSIQLKQQDYKNEYYKKILEKRLEAYKYVEDIVSSFQVKQLNSNNEPCHYIFSNFKLYSTCLENFLCAMRSRVWINEDTLRELENLQAVFFDISLVLKGASVDDLMHIGEDHFLRIAGSHEKLERYTRLDLENLHNMKYFMKKSSNPVSRSFFYRVNK